MMSEKLDWTQKLGDAFLAQQKDVMATVQTLRAKAAKRKETLKDTKEQKIVTEQARPTTIIKIEPANPQVVYVPTYNPTVVYGAWPYPAYPPYYYYPPGYASPAPRCWASLPASSSAARCGATATGARGDVNINVNRYNNFNQHEHLERQLESRRRPPRRGPLHATRASRSSTVAARSPTRRRAMRFAGATAGRSRSTRDAGRGASVRHDATWCERRLDGRGTARCGRPRSAAAICRCSRRQLRRGRRAAVALRRATCSGTRSSSAFDTGRGAQTRDASSRGRRRA